VVVVVVVAVVVVVLVVVVAVVVVVVEVVVGFEKQLFRGPSNPRAGTGYKGGALPCSQKVKLS